MKIIHLFLVLAGALILGAASPIPAPSPPPDPLFNANVQQALLSLLSSVVGGGIVVALFRGAVDDSLHKSDTLKLLVHAQVNEHPTIKSLQKESEDISGMVKQTAASVHQIELDMATLTGALSQFLNIKK